MPESTPAFERGRYGGPSAAVVVVVFFVSLVIISCGGETNEGNKGGGGTSGSGGSTGGGSGRGGSTGGGTGGSAGSGGEAAVGSVTCGSFSAPAEECAPEEYCCGANCVTDDTPCTGSAFHCDDAADCPGAFCCVAKLSTLDGGSQVAQCQATCDSDTQLIVCHGPGDGCPSGMTCEITATLPPAYGYCCPSSEPCSAT